MLIVCPMCGPFSSLMFWNYSRMSPEQAREKLESAMRHLKLSLELCLKQYEAGRFFIFEHPVGATSWDTELIKNVLRLEGVYMARFDFCQLGMLAEDDAGNEMPTKKRTGVMTNSKNLAEALRQAQCRGLHKHVHLLNGKASACQVYPRQFCELVCQAVQKEIDDLKWRNRVTKNMDVTKEFEDLVQSINLLETATQDIDGEEGVQGGIGLPADEAVGRNSVFGPSLRSLG